MAKYRRMTWTDRLKIETLYNSGSSYRFIASYTGFSVSSVYAEVQHGLYDHLGAETSRRPRHYSAQIAQDYADSQSSAKGVPIKLGHNYDYAHAVARQIVAGLSPDVIVGSLRRSGGWTVSTSTLYRYIDRGYIPGITNHDLPEKMRRSGRRRRLVRAARPPKGMSIERRSSAVDARLSFGHWEMDSICGCASGQRQSLIVLTERMTRFEIILRAKAKTTAATLRCLESALSKYPQGTFQTITCDNGSEFQDCKGMEYGGASERRLRVYYCHPCCPHERGSNERANRLIRRWFPKGKSMAKVTQKQCDFVASQINNLPRKILGYATPHELFQQELQKLSPAFV